MELEGSTMVPHTLMTNPLYWSYWSPYVPNRQQLKQCMPYSNIGLMQTPIFEWYMARLVLKNGRQKTSVTMRLEFVLKK